MRISKFSRRFRYFSSGIIDVDLIYNRASNNINNVIRFVDANHDGDFYLSVITSYVFTLFINQNVNLQKVALFEAKYMIETKVINKAIWLRSYLCDFGLR